MSQKLYFAFIFEIKFHWVLNSRWTVSELFFFPNTLKILLLHGLSAYIVSNKKSVVLIIFFFLSVCDMSFFPLAALKVLSLPLCLSNLMMLCLGRVFFIFLVLGFGGLLGSLNL